MSTSLLPCTFCKRHFRGSEPICPFCFARRAGSTVAFAVAIGGAVGGLDGCRDTTPQNGSTVAPEPDAGRTLTLSPPRPVYGPPAGFPGDRIPGLKGAIAIAPVTATVPVPNADRAIAIAQPALRTCYQTGLRREPTMAGTLVVTLAIDASGAVSSVTTDGPLSAPVQDCMKDRLKLIKFDAPGRESSLTTQLTCTSTHD